MGNETAGAYLFLAALGPCCCMQAFSSCSESRLLCSKLCIGVCARVCVCTRVTGFLCLTLVPHSGVCTISQTLASTCALSLFCQSVLLLSPPFLLLPSRPPTRGQLLCLSFSLSLLSPAHFLRGCVRARVSASRRLSLGLVPVSPSVSF